MFKFISWVNEKFSDLTIEQLGSYSMYSNIYDRYINYTLRDIQLDTLLIFESLFELIHTSSSKYTNSVGINSSDIINKCKSFNNPLKIIYGGKEINYELFLQYIFDLNKVLHQTYLDIINTSKPIEESITVYRGIRINVDNEIFYGNSGLMSCSLAKSIAKKFGYKGIVFEIHLPVGTKICPIFSCSYHNEQEIVIVSNGILDILSVNETIDHKFLTCNFSIVEEDKNNFKGISLNKNPEDLKIGVSKYMTFKGGIYARDFNFFSWSGVKPIKIITDKEGNVYTCNYVSNDVTKVNSKGIVSNYKTMGERPTDMCIDRDGNIYTCNAKTNNVTCITPDGIVTIIGRTDKNPSGIDIDNDGNIYVCNEGSDNVTQIIKGKGSRIFGKTGRYPRDISIDKNGNIYTCNLMDDSVTQIIENSDPLLVGKTGRGPSAIAIDNNGNIYTCNTISNDVTQINPKRKSIIFGKSGINPKDISIDGNGNIYTCNFNTSNITQIIKNSKPYIIGTTGKWPSSINIDNRGNIYTCSISSNTISKIELLTVPKIN